jgi:hypothetical protein
MPSQFKMTVTEICLVANYTKYSQPSLRIKNVQLQKIIQPKTAEILFLIAQAKYNIFTVGI